MENIKFKIGDRVKVLKSYDSDLVQLNIGAIGTVKEEDTEPWIWFDDNSQNYTSKGTAVSQYKLELVK